MHKVQRILAWFLLPRPHALHLQVQELQATLAVERGAAAKTLAGLEQQLAADETARMSRTLSQDLGLSASTVQALQEAHTIRVSREHERTAAKHQVCRG